jgi:hypothetical protein
MVVGLNYAGSNGTEVAEIVANIRFDTGDGNIPAADLSAGLKVDVLYSGPYDTGGVSGMINDSYGGEASNWAAAALSYYQTNCPEGVSQCPSIEVLNEPSGSWFWGSNAQDSTNETAYAGLVEATWTAFHNALGSGSPLILASYDSSDGSNSPSNWWHGVEAANANINNYFDGAISHDYGGDGTPCVTSGQGNRAQTTAAHTYTGKPTWVTEIGWPTDQGDGCTGDSEQWTDEGQATNIWEYIDWARSTGYVGGVFIFGSNDYGTNDGYGVMTSGGTKKPAWTALGEAAANEACTVCCASICATGCGSSC